MSALRRRRPTGDDVGRHMAAMPDGRLPYLIASTAGALTLLTPHPKRRAGLTPAEAASVLRVRDRLTEQHGGRARIGLWWMDPNTGDLIAADVTPSWMRRKLASCAAVRLA